MLLLVSELCIVFIFDHIIPQPIYYLRYFNILKNMSLLNNKLCRYQVPP